MSYLKKLFYGNYLLIMHYLTTLKQLYSFMPEIKEIAFRSKKNDNFEIKFSKNKINKINESFQDVNKKILYIEKDVWQFLGYESKKIIFFIIRILMIYLVYYEKYTEFFLLSLTQFILLPYSFFSSISLTFDLLIARNLGSYMSSLVLNNLVDWLCPSWLNYKYKIDDLFVLGFHVIEQLVCFVFLFRTFQGKTVLFGFKRIMQSVIYGFINCKTYTLCLLFLVKGHDFPVTTFIIDYLIGFSRKIFDFSILYRPLFVYVQHRCAHIGVVYQEAHKYHHYLHDSTGFDTHYMGIGAPEEYFMFLLEIFPVFFFKGMLPSFSPPMLYQNFESKQAHVRKEGDFHSLSNFHTNHHYYHTKNFSTFACPLDVLFKTTWNADEYQFLNNFNVSREENEDNVVLKFVK